MTGVGDNDPDRLWLQGAASNETKIIVYAMYESTAEIADALSINYARRREGTMGSLRYYVFSRPHRDETVRFGDQVFNVPPHGVVAILSCQSEGKKTARLVDPEILPLQLLADRSFPCG